MPMQDYKFRLFAWEFLALLDTGKFDEITVDEVRKHAEAETLPAFLKDRFDARFDGLMEASDWIDLSREWASFANAIDSRRKMGIENRGLCLLLGYALQSLQNRRPQTE